MVQLTSGFFFGINYHISLFRKKTVDLYIVLIQKYIYLVRIKYKVCRNMVVINNDVSLSGLESQVTAPGTELHIYSDLTTSWVSTGTEPSNGI